jgi:hypothetical protein
VLGLEKEMTIRLMLSLFILLLPSIAFSATPEQQQVYLRQCESLLGQNAEISDATRDFYISRIASWGRNTSNIEGSLNCLRGLTGSSSWSFDPRTAEIVNADIQDYQNRIFARRCEIRILLLEYQEVFDEISAYSNQRMFAFRTQTYDECNSLYKTNRSAALLNPICHDIFAELGVPLERPESLSDERISEARRNTIILEEEASIIERHGLLLADYLALNPEEEYTEAARTPEADWWEDCP